MSPKAYDGQENFRLIVRTGIDFAAHPPSEMKILYRLKKNPIWSEWEASILSGGEARGEIYYDFGESFPVPAAGFYWIRAVLKIDGKDVPTGMGKWAIGRGIR